MRILETTSDIYQLEITNYAVQQLLQHYTAARLPTGSWTVVKVGVAATLPAAAAAAAVPAQPVSVRRAPARPQRGDSNVSSSSNGGDAAGLYALLPGDVKPIVKPYLTSRFTVEKTNRAQPEQQRGECSSVQ